MLKRLLAGLAVAGLLTTVQSARAGILFATDFEAPTYTTGLLGGQDGWFTGIGPAFVSVQNSVAESGTQAVQITATGAPPFSRGVHTNLFDTTASSLKTIHLSVDALIETDGTASQWRPLGAFNGAGNFIVEMIVQSSGALIVLRDGIGQTNTGVTVDRDVWNTYELLLDFSAGTLDAFLNGLLVASDVTFNNSNSVYSAAALSLGSSVGTDLAFFDNFAVEVVPEPATLALLGLALAGLGFARRRKGFTSSGVPARFATRFAVVCATIAIAGSGLMAAVPARASLMDIGPAGEYFFDSDTGLYWQDPANFLGASRSDIDDFLAANSSWKLATQSEMEALLGKSSQGAVPLTDIMGPEQFTTTSGQLTGDRWWGFLDETTVDPLLPGNPNGWLVQTCLNQPACLGVSDLTMIGATGFQNLVENVQHGAWLNSTVNPVPEPATLTLLGIALAGLGFARRSKLH